MHLKKQNPKATENMVVSFLISLINLNILILNYFFFLSIKTALYEKKEHSDKHFTGDQQGVNYFIRC